MAWRGFSRCGRRDTAGRRAGRHQCRRCRATDAGSEEGFTVIELMVALVVIAVAAVGLAYAGTISMVDIAFANQRQAATGLVNQAVEEARALPFSTLAAGLSTNDPTFATDTNITTQGSGSSTTYWYGGEQMPVSSSTTPVTPLNPHIQSGIVVGTNTYTVSVYVTYAQPPNTSAAPSSVQVFRVTAIASWANSERHGTLTSVQNQTVLYSPNGCQSGSTHPYTAPCQPFFYGSASDLGGSVVVSGSGGGSPIPAVSDVGSVTLYRTSVSSGSQLEQVQATHGSSSTTGGVITYTDGTTQQSSGSQAASVAATNDSTSSQGAYQSGSVSQSSSAITATSATSPASLTVTPSTSDTGAAVATVSAGQPASNSCSNLGGTAVTNGQACTNVQATQAPAAATTVLGWTPTGPSSIGNVTLASVGAPPSATVAVTERDPTAGTSTCTGVPSATDGCIHAGATRSIGTVELAELPSGISPLPAGWNVTKGLVELTGFSDAVSSEAGVGAAAPSASVTGGTITYWNGTGYSSLAASSVAGTAIPAASVTVNDPTYPGGDVQISITPSLTVGGTAIQDPAAGCSAPCTRTQASATSSSPIQGTIAYQVTYNGTVIVNAVLAVDLGTLSTSTTYQPAPSSAP